MKKAMLGIIAMVMALAMTIPVTGVASAQTTEDVLSAEKRALAIKAPEIARTGQLLTITVFTRHNNRPVPRAGVWAMNVNDVAVLSNDIEEYTSLVEKDGYFLGWTDRKGNVTHRFREPGRYILVATKHGFSPGFAKISIKPVNLTIESSEDTRGNQQIVTAMAVKQVRRPELKADVQFRKVIQAKEAINKPIQVRARVELAKGEGPFMEPGNSEDEKLRFRYERHLSTVLENRFVQELIKLNVKPLQFIQSLELALAE